MNWDTLQQLVRIVLYTGGSFMFGQAVADGQLFQSAVGGVLATGAFVWWYIWERQRT